MSSGQLLTLFETNWIKIEVETKHKIIETLVKQKI
jgi:hypothetical protein